MTGRATLTTVLSRNAMLDPRMATASAQRGSLVGGVHGARRERGTALSNIARQLTREPNYRLGAHIQQTVVGPVGVAVPLGIGWAVTEQAPPGTLKPASTYPGT